MILHGIESPNIVHQNTLETNIQEIQNKDRVDVILANPPFGGKEKSIFRKTSQLRQEKQLTYFCSILLKS